MKINHILIVITSIIVLLYTTGCSIFSPIQNKNITHYTFAYINNNDDNNGNDSNNDNSHYYPDNVVNNNSSHDSIHSGDSNRSGNKTSISKTESPKSTNKPINHNENTNNQQAVLRIIPTIANTPYNSYKMYYITTPLELNSYAISQWAALPQDIINQSIVQKISRARIYKNVVGGEFTSFANYSLSAQLLKLDLVNQNNHKSTNTKAQVRMSIVVHLTNNSNNTIIKSTTFTETTSTELSPSGFALGASQCLNQFLDQLSIWLNDTTSKD